MKEAGSFKSVIFHFDSALGSRKKEPFAPKVQRLYQPKKKKKKKKRGGGLGYPVGAEKEEKILVKHKLGLARI